MTASKNFEFFDFPSHFLNKVLSSRRVRSYCFQSSAVPAYHPVLSYFKKSASFLADWPFHALEFNALEFLMCSFNASHYSLMLS